MAVPARINFVTLGVQDVERSRRFYAALGWEEGPQSQAPQVRQTVAFFDLDGLVFAVYRRDLLAADVGAPDTEPGFPAFRGVTLAVNVEAPEQVAGVLAEAEAAGGSVRAPAKEMEWGGVAGYFADPDGHAWEVAYNPGMPLGPDGRIRLR